MASPAENARAKAAAQFADTKKPPEDAVWRERTKRHEAETQKMLQLRALRLEKEAADKVAAAAAAAAEKPVPRAKRSREPTKPAGES
jgi:hypothetical protein